MLYRWLAVHTFERQLDRTDFKIISLYHDSQITQFRNITIAIFPDNVISEYGDITISSYNAISQYDDI
jgi:hypothetical protein